MNEPDPAPIQPEKVSARLWIVQFLLGVSSGLPLLLVGSTLQAYLTDQKVDLTTIGIFAFVKTPYTWKFLWSPLLDRYRFPGFKRRKGWILFTQICLMFTVFFMGSIDPATAPWAMAFLALLVSFFSASQDIVIDAYRREALPEKMIGLGNTVAITGYRLGMILTGAVALMLADQIPWSHVFQIVSTFMLIGIVAALFAPEKDLKAYEPKSLRDSVVDPFVAFFTQKGAWLILLFIILYKAGDNMAVQMNVTYILKQGYTKTEYAAFAKGLGIIATIAGGFIGGFALTKIGIKRSLWIFGILQALTTGTFSLLYGRDHSLPLLGFLIVIENLSLGMGTSAFVTYLASLTSVRFTATQYALLSSLAAISGSLLAAPTGWMAQNFGWVGFYWACAFAAIPGLVILWFLQRMEANQKVS